MFSRNHIQKMRTCNADTGENCRIKREVSPDRKLQANPVMSCEEIIMEKKERISMNEKNYASLEASTRSNDAGIVLETDAVWFLGIDGQWHLADRWLSLCVHKKDKIPAPSMAEVWRELPDEIMRDNYEYYLSMEKGLASITKAGYSNPSLLTKAGYDSPLMLTIAITKSVNPTDALIDLLIWVKETGEGIEPKP